MGTEGGILETERVGPLQHDGLRPPTGSDVSGKTKILVTFLAGNNDRLTRMYVNGCTNRI